jgi:hypothetical protein
VRVVFAAAIAVLALAACSSNDTSAKAEKCTDLFMSSMRLHSQGRQASTRHYISVTYCNRFAREGWVYDDGALSIDAQRWLVRGGSEVCGRSSTGGQTRTETVPCEQLEAQESFKTIDCAMLERVRRSEVREYIAALQKRTTIACDDGTPLNALGVP